MNIKQLYQELEAKIQQSYEQGTSLDEAERLAARFLQAQMIVSVELKKADLNARMRKTGVKAIRAAIYMEAANKPEKKPTEAALAAIVDSNDLVIGEQNSLDEFEVNKAELERYYDVFLNGHIYYRGISKGRFE